MGVGFVGITLLALPGDSREADLQGKKSLVFLRQYPAAVIDWVKNIPSQKSTNGVEFNVTPDGVTLVSCIQNDYQLSTAATVSGVTPRAVLTLDREIILRMLLQGYNTFSAHSDGLVPVIASGGAGQYIAMPIRTISKNPIQPKQEEKKMEIENNVVEQTAPVANPLDELGTAIEDFKFKIKHETGRLYLSF